MFIEVTIFSITFVKFDQFWIKFMWIKMEMIDNKV